MSVSIHELGKHPEIWGDVTDPNQHKNDDFRYLVHAINPYAKLNAIMIASYASLDGLECNKNWGDQSISLYEEPERVSERVSLSMSLIDQDHTETWGDAGLIVEAPESNVIITSSADTGALNDNIDLLLKQARSHGVMSGDSLLRYTYGKMYNEVVAIANYDGHQLQLSGFFYKVTSKGEPLDKMLADQMKAHAKRSGLPVIEIVQENPYAENLVTRHTAYGSGRIMLGVQFDGKFYHLDGFEDNHIFKTADEKGSYHFASPNEFKAALEYAIETGEVAAEEAENISKAYAEADTQRSTPTAEFDENSDFKKISYYQGYGSEEYKITLFKSGESYREHTETGSRKMQEAMLGRMQLTGYGLRDRSHSLVSPHEASGMVEQACKQLTDAQASALKEWFEAHRSTVHRRWVQSKGYLGITEPPLETFQANYSAFTKNSYEIWKDFLPITEDKPVSPFYLKEDVKVGDLSSETDQIYGV